MLENPKNDLKFCPRCEEFFGKDHKCFNQKDHKKLKKITENNKGVNKILKVKLRVDILNLGIELLGEITKPLIIGKEESRDMARRRRRQKVKQLKNSLAEKVGVWDLIHKAEEIDKNGL